MGSCEPALDHCIDHDIELIARFEAILDNATLWSNDGPVISALVRGDLLGIPIMFDEAEEVRATATLGHGLDGSFTVQSIVGFH
jgi:hypothetical protein